MKGIVDSVSRGAIPSSADRVSNESDSSDAYNLLGLGANSEPTLMSGSAVSYGKVGIVGICITSFLWIIVSWRLFYHYSGWWCTNSCCSKRVGEEEDIRTDGLTTKRLLHVLLWTTMVVEGVAYADMISTDSSNKLNYTLLDIVGRGILEFWTFIIGTVYWFNVISQSRVGDKRLAFAFFPSILALITIGVTVSCILEAVALLTGSETIDEFRETSKIHRITLMVEAAGWGIHAVIVAVCGTFVYKRIQSLPTLSQVRSQAKRNIINKMIIPMVFCALSYALRSGWMAADFASRIVSPEVTFEAGVGWWVGNCWIPTFVPSIMLLYSIRKRDREPVESIGITNTLLHSPQSSESDLHADPFQSFHQTFRDFEDE